VINSKLRNSVDIEISLFSSFFLFLFQLEKLEFRPLSTDMGHGPNNQPEWGYRSRHMTAMHLKVPEMSARGAGTSVLGLM
jgi:hypothetical protein